MLDRDGGGQRNVSARGCSFAQFGRHPSGGWAFRHPHHQFVPDRLLLVPHAQPGLCHHQSRRLEPLLQLSGYAAVHNSSMVLPAPGRLRSGTGTTFQGVPPALPVWPRRVSVTSRVRTLKRVSYPDRQLPSGLSHRRVTVLPRVSLAQNKRIRGEVDLLRWDNTRRGF